MSEWIETTPLEELVKRWEEIVGSVKHSTRPGEPEPALPLPIITLQRCITELQAVLSTASERTQYGMKQIVQPLKSN